MPNEEGKGKVIGVEDEIEKVEDLNKEIRDLLQKQKRQAVCTVLIDRGVPSSLPEETSARGDEDMQMVKNLIEQCLVQNMSQKQVMDILYQKENIHPSFTQTVWQHLEEQNEKFFIVYYERVALIREVKWLGKRIDKLITIIRSQLYPSNEVTAMMNNNYDIPTTPQIDRRQVGKLGLKLQAPAATTVRLQPPAPANCRQAVWRAPN